MPSKKCPDMIYLSANDVIRIVNTVGLSTCIKDVAQRIKSDFLRWQDFHKNARVAYHSESGVIELMPIADAHEFAFKYVNGHPNNTHAGLPTVMGFGVLADVDTGVPRLLSELTLTTAIRTAAMSALAAGSLSRRDSRSMALIGNGAQSEFQALAFRDLIGIRVLRVFDVDTYATAKLVSNLAAEGFDITVCKSAEEAAQTADIITTVTADKTNATIVTSDMIGAGVHVNAVGGDCPGKTELHVDVLRQADVFVEFEPQTRIEGDIQQMPLDFPVTELWRVFAGLAPGRTSHGQITVFDSVGFALEDYSGLCYMRDKASTLGLGQVLEIVPTSDDPKNLFGMLETTVEMAAA